MDTADVAPVEPGIRDPATREVAATVLLGEVDTVVSAAAVTNPMGAADMAARWEHRTALPAVIPRTDHADLRTAVSGVVTLDQTGLALAPVTVLVTASATESLTASVMGSVTAAAMDMVTAPTALGMGTDTVTVRTGMDMVTGSGMATATGTGTGSDSGLGSGTVSDSVLVTGTVMDTTAMDIMVTMAVTVTGTTV